MSGFNTSIPGVSAAHAIVTPACRANRGVGGAFDEAVARLRGQYERLAADCPTFNLHLVLTSEEPE
jgi:hypothetical protein